MKKTTKMLSVIFAAILLFTCVPVLAFAGEPVASGYCGKNLAWTLNDTTLTINRAANTSGEIKMDNYYTNTANLPPWYAYRASITEVIIQAGVAKIGDYAFYNCTALQSVTMGNQSTPNINSVYSVGKYTFYNCTSLTSVSFGNNMYKIFDYAFGNCASLETLTLPAVLEETYNGAFSGCGNLKNIYYDGTLEGWCHINQYGAINTANGKIWIKEDGGGAYYSIEGDIIIPDSVTQIGARAFYCCDKITSVTLPKGLTKIGYYAFSGCTLLPSITLPEDLTILDIGTFYNCESLSSVEIPEGVKRIERETFFNCSSLQSVFIPEGVTFVGENAFADCNNIAEIRFGGTIAQWCEINFESSVRQIASVPCDLKMKNSAGEYDTVAGDIVIPDGVSEIGIGAFLGCSEITSVTISDSVTNISRQAFCGCSSLQSVRLSENLKYINPFAFSDCENLSSITLPVSLRYIGFSVFCGCDKPENIYYEGTLADWMKTNVQDEIVHNASQKIWVKDSEGSYYKVEGEITVPEGVTSIRSYAFACRTKVTAINIPVGVTKIGSYAFENCTGLTAVKIPEGVTEIGSHAFGFCENLSSVILPVSIKEIGFSAFCGCDKLKDIYYRGSLEDWNNIKYELNNPCIGSDVTIHYNYVSCDEVGHDTVSHDAKAPTCTEPGWDAYETCTRCDYSTYSQIPALGHHYTQAQFVWNGAECTAWLSCSCSDTQSVACTVEVEPTKDPTYEEEGILTITATAEYGSTVFTDVITQTIPALEDEAPETFIEKIQVFMNKILDWFKKLFG